MAQERDPGEVFEALYEAAEVGLVGTLEVAIHDNQATVVFGPTTADIVELIVDGQATGTYRATLTAPATLGDYSINWSNDGSFDPEEGGASEVLTVADTTLTLPSLGAALEDSVLCSAWTTTEEVIDCCSAEIGSDTSFLEASLVAASELLYFASGRQWVGACARTVRPCKTDSCLCGYQVLSRGHLVGWDGLCWSGESCGCRPESRVPLSGYVREITEVKIDGVVIDPSEYFVYRHRDLVRKNGARWPRCQSLDLDDTEEGTFSVAYTYGKAPPVSGQIAAARLACEVVKSCTTPDEACAIPRRAVRVTRQGITIEAAFLQRDREGGWRTGMWEVDVFLNAVNPRGIMRAATAYSATSGNRYPTPEAI